MQWWLKPTTCVIYHQNFPQSAFFTLHTLCFPPYCLTFHQRGTKTCLCQDKGFHWVPVVCLETRIIQYHGALWSPCCNLAVISNSSWIEGRTTLWIILFGVDPRISFENQRWASLASDQLVPMCFLMGSIQRQ